MKQERNLFGFVLMQYLAFCYKGRITEIKDI